jgi:hemin uptake protein HemP
MTDSSTKNPEPAGESTVRRFSSQELLGQQREVQIEHQGRIYRLRLTSLNKLILTA